MKNKTLYILLILIVLIGQSVTLLAQKDSIEVIQQMVLQIENDSNLTKKEFAAEEVYNHLFDGGGSILICFDDSGLEKVKEEIGLSFGRITTTIYFHNNLPIKIIETEENFPFLDDGSGLDYSVLNQVFQTEIYIYDWKKAQGESVEKGKRVLSEETCGIFEYESVIEIGLELMNK